MIYNSKMERKQVFCNYSMIFKGDLAKHILTNHKNRQDYQLLVEKIIWFSIYGFVSPIGYNKGHRQA